MSNLPTIGIIVINWNNVEQTLKCLNSVYKMDYPYYKVLVIDNGSDEDPELVLRKQFQRIKYIRNSSNLGYTGGNNLGMKAFISEGVDFIWLLNNDAVVEKDCLSNLINSCIKHKNVGLASPVIYNNNFDNKLLYCGTSIDIEKGTKRQARNFNELQQWVQTIPHTICLWGTALLISRPVIEEIGYLDERFFAYSEDMDYSIRSINAGFENIIVENAKLFHEERKGNFEIIPYHYHYYMMRNEYLFWKKYNNLKDKYYFEAINKSCNFYIKNNDNAAEATLDGIWSAIRGYSGDFDKRKKFPKLLKIIIKNHPNIIKALSKRLSAKF